MGISSIKSKLRKSMPQVFSITDVRDMLANNYKAPLKVLEKWVKDGELIRLKKGLYVFPNDYDQLAVAQALYGPSYISYETALGYYGLIPERVEAVISVVDGRSSRFFSNGVHYYYRSQKRELYSLGMSMVTIAGRDIHFASREKAFLDTLSYKRLNTRNLTTEEVFRYVQDSLRIELDSLLSFSLRRLQCMASLYHNKACKLFVEELKRVKNRGEL